MEYKEFDSIKHISLFKSGPHLVLIHTLEDLFGASVDLVFSPIIGFKTKFNIDITNEPKRELYRVDEPFKTTLMVVYVEHDSVLYYLGIKLSSPQLPYLDSSIFHYARLNIGRKLKIAVENSFKSCVSLFNETLVKDIIIGFIGQGHYDFSKISYLMDMFLELRSTTFEGKFFSTGLIITRSIYAYKKSEEFKKKGRLVKLAPKIEINITDKLKKRIWFLADGFRSFYLTNLKTDINSMFIYEGMDDDYVGDMLLSKTLLGADALFRVSGGRELSIVNSDGYEFLHQENKWKFRDYNALKTCILKWMPEVKGFYDDLIRYVLYCSKNDTSSIIWVPKDISSIKNIVVEKTMHEFSLPAIKLKDAVNLPIVKRLLSSDGATVIDKDGKIRYFGCFADLSKATIGGVKGTGETAASLLAQNGMAIKISQDGPINVFIEGMDQYIPF